MSFTRKMSRTRLFEKRGSYSAFWFKIAQKLPKGASVSENAKKLASRIWKGLKLTAGWAWLKVFRKSVAVLISGITVTVSSTSFQL